jgi:hypothetical protein
MESPLGRIVHSAAITFEVGFAKPDSAICPEAVHRLGGELGN